MPTTLAFTDLLGPQNPYRFWIIMFFLCLGACCTRTYRRAGSIGLVVYLAVLGVAVFVRSAYFSCVPQ